MLKRIIKDPQREIQIFTRRTWIATSIVCFLLAILLFRLIYLQVIQHRFYVTLSNQNQLSLVPIEPKRGLIYDRNGILLAENIPVFSLEVIPEKVDNLRDTLAALAKVVTINEDDIRQFYKQLKQRRRFESVPLRIRLTEEEVARFAVDQYHFPGVVIHAQLIRHYSLGPLMAQALGYVGRINEKELNRLDTANYSASNYIGKLGIEKYYEEQLHGKVGYQQVEIDANGHIVRMLKTIPPIPGDNLILNLDSGLQMAAAEALANERGALVAIQPKTGAVLALVSHPSYDPNPFVQGISNQAYQALQNSTDQPLYNRALRGQYPLGSTIKPFISLEGLESGIVDPDYRFYDPGWYKLPNSTHLYRDWKHNGGHGWVNMSSAIMQSCDVYFYNLAAKLGIERIDDIMAKFGFGQLTGIDVEEELAGLIPSPAWKRRVHGMPWFPGDTLISGIGQGFMLTTPLQLASATATLANHGQGYQPSLLWYSKSANGQITQVKPTPLAPIHIQPEHWRIVWEAMRSALMDPQGTGWRFAKGATYTMAGKTGTVQVFSLKKNQKDISELLPQHLRDNSLLIAFAPYEDPEIALAVVVEHSGQAGNVARKVLDYYFARKIK